jgi:N utilization substance protein B
MRPHGTLKKSSGVVESSARRIDRTRARAWALQIHYQWDVGERDGTFTHALKKVVSMRRIAESRMPYLRRLAAQLDARGDELDQLLEVALDNWRMGRLALLDRGILRIAAAELVCFDDIPPKVSIQEAVRLAERYSGPESPRFVNGVLDALYKRVIS